MNTTELEQEKHHIIRDFPNWLRAHFSLSQRFMSLCLLAGVLCGLAAVSFHLSIAFVFEHLMDYARPLMGLEGANLQSQLRFVVLMTLAPALGGLFVGIIIHKFAKDAAGSGIPQTKSTYYRNFGIFSFRQAIYRFTLGTVFIGLGNSLGREGPTVHMCASIASKIGQFFGLAKVRIQAMVPVGMAAGIAAAFNAPLSAITFVFEELLDDFSTKALGGIVIAVVVAATIERSILGEHPIFPTTLQHFSSSWWMLVCIPLGLASAFLGHFFVTCLLSARAKVKSMQSIPVWVRPAIGGLMVGFLASMVYLMTGQDGVFSVGYQNLKLTTAHGALFWTFLALLLGKFIATIISYATGGSGGLFSPVLVCGGMLGALFGLAVTQVFTLPAGTAPNQVVGACALLGMGTFFAAVIRCPFTSILIIFEMTLNYSLILPLMAGNMIAYYLARKMRSVPIYDSLLLQDGVNLRSMPNYQGNQDYQHLPISTIMSYDVTTIDATLDADAALERIPWKHHAYPVLNQNKLLGIITHHELEEFKRDGNKVSVGDIVSERMLVCMTPDTSIRDAANKLISKDVLQTPIVSLQDNTKLIGIVTLHDIARAQNSFYNIMGRENATN